MPYTDKLLLIQNLLQRTYENDELYDEILETLGNSISALESVPTAIYCFLKSCAETTDMKVKLLSLVTDKLILQKQKEKCIFF